MQDTMKDDLEERLDAFFGDDEDDQAVSTSMGPVNTVPARTSSGKATPKPDKPLENLKAVILSMEWEINDEIMNSFIDEVQNLTIRYKGNRIFQLFLKLHDSIGKYIKIKKAAAHPSSIQFLNDLFDSFESVVMKQERPQAEVEKILLKEVNNFKALKKRILLAKGESMDSLPAAESSAVSTKPVQEAVEPAPAVKPPAEKKKTVIPSVPSAEAPPIPKETMDYLLEEIKRTIRAELQKILQHLM